MFTPRRTAGPIPRKASQPREPEQGPGGPGSWRKRAEPREARPKTRGPVEPGVHFKNQSRRGTIGGKKKLFSAENRDQN
jgi:hypothetical protein